MALNCTQLQNLTQKSNESFKAYAQRWKELDTCVQPPMLDREIIDMFMDTLQVLYLENMIGGAPSSFFDLVIIGECIESICSKAEKIPNA